MEYTRAYYEHYRDNQQAPSCWRRANNTCPPHFHSCLELVAVLDGAMDSTLAGKPCRTGAGELLLIPSYTVHFFFSAVDNDSIVLSLPLDYVPSLKKRLSDQAFPAMTLTASPAVDEIIRCMEILSAGHNGPGEAFLMRGYIHVIIGRLLECVPLEPAGRTGDTGPIRDILGYLDLNYQSPITLEGVAAQFGYSSSRFSHIFNQNVGCGISQYLASLRCRHAANLLLEQDVTILDAAMLSGFESMRTFYRSFKQCFGVTPRQYLTISCK